MSDSRTYLLRVYRQLKELKRGTAWSPEEGFVVTAWHVVSDAGQWASDIDPSTEYIIERGADGAPVVLEPVAYDVRHDLAVLAIAGGSPGKLAKLGCEIPTPANIEDHPFRTEGYPTSAPADEWVAAEGKILKFDRSARYPIQLSVVHGSRETAEGLSGAPVLVGGKVVGIVPWQQSESELWAVPTDALEKLMQRSGAPPRPSVYVVLSESARKVSADAALSKVVEDAVRGDRDLRKEFNLTTDQKWRPKVFFAGDAIASRSAFELALANFCRAHVVIFDVTNFEPATMLLAGIRSVVRRGVTLLSSAADLRGSDWFQLPFNFKDINILSHGIGLERAAKQLARCLKEGLELSRRVPHYLDLPSFDPVRRISPRPGGGTAQTAVSPKERVLVLCSFAEERRQRWDRIQERIRASLPGDMQRSSEIQRTVDIPSPRLVSHTLYEAIRVTDMCLVDLTGIRPNVFFELGARLASNPLDPVCIVDEQAIKAMNLDGDLVPVQVDETGSAQGEASWYAPGQQCRRLFEMLDPLPYRLDDGQSDIPRLIDRFEQHERGQSDPTARSDNGVLPGAATGSGSKFVLQPGDTYRAVALRVDPLHERPPPIYRELLVSAEALDVSQQTGQSTALYSSNRLISEAMTEAAIDRRVAAWLYLAGVYELDEILDNKVLAEAFEAIGNQTYNAVESSPLPQHKKLAAQIDETLVAFRKQRRNRHA